MNTPSKDQVAWRVFLMLCREAKTPRVLDELFQLLMTSEERNALAMRVALVRELLFAEKTQRTIAEELEVSIAKITRGSNALKEIPPGLRKFLLEVLS